MRKMLKTLTTVSSQHHTCYKTLVYALLFSMSILLSSCAGKFSRTQSVNLTPFAKQTMQMVGLLHYGLTDSEVLYLHDVTDYIDEDEPFKRYIALEEMVERMLKGIVAYSLQVVTISEQDISVEKKNKALVDILLRLGKFLSEDSIIPYVNAENRKSKADIIKKIKISETYLQALQQSQILVNSFNAHAGKVLDELKEEKKLVSIKITAAIEKKYRTSIDFIKLLRKARQKHYSVLLLATLYDQTKDKKYLAQINKLNLHPVDLIIKGRKKISRNDLLKIHKVVTERLLVLGKNREQVMPDVKLYYKSTLELKKIIKSKSDALKDARLTFILWSKAHTNMSAGKSNPAEWFDVSETGSLLFGAARRATGL